ncbi:MAG: cysteine hydrolase [Clostridia bacterium]|nr:cysteine hydrolase [Clostridia bacterium]
MNKILVVVDMQNDFVDEALGTKEAQAIVGNVCNKIKNSDCDIIVTYDTHFENYLETAEGRKLPVKHCIRETHGWQLNENVEAALLGKNVTRVEKLTFGSTSLPEIIRSKYNTDNMEIELVGLCTDICVVSNALILKANFPEINISVDASCCAGVTVENHEAALKTMVSCQIDVKESL